MILLRSKLVILLELNYLFTFELHTSLRYCFVINCLKSSALISRSIKVKRRWRQLIITEFSIKISVLWNKCLHRLDYSNWHAGHFSVFIISFLLPILKMRRCLTVSRSVTPKLRVDLTKCLHESGLYSQG